MKSYKRSLLVFLIIFLIFFVAYYYFNKINSRYDGKFNIQNRFVSHRKAYSALGNIVSIINKSYINIQTSFVIVNGFENLIDSVSTEDITTEKYKLVAVRGTIPNEICELIKNCDKVQFVENYEEIVSLLKNNQMILGLLPFEIVDFRVKILAFNNISIWEGRSEYQLKAYQIFESFNPKYNSQSTFDPSKIVRVGHTGSFIPARGVMLHTRKFFNGNLEPMIEPMKGYFSRFDILSATQEISLLGSGVYCDSCMSFVGSENEISEMLLPLGVDIVTMAANHVLDGGYQALGNTLDKLKENNIKVIGASTENNEKALEPILVEKKGLKIAYIAFNDTPGIEQWATNQKGGAASLSDWIIEGSETVLYQPNVDRVKRVMAKAKNLNPDYIIILPHWGGVEYQNIPTSYVTNLANLLIQEGADIIIGDHPHWIQKIEWHNNNEKSYAGLKQSPIFYSVGNFIFDQMWSYETRVGMSVELIFYEKNLKAINISFHKLNLYDKGTINQIDDKNEIEQLLKNIFEISEL